MGFGSLDPRDLKQFRVGSRRDFNRLKGRAYAAAGTGFAVGVLGSGGLADSLLAIEEKSRLKIIQTAIKPLVKEMTKAWKDEVLRARTSGKYERSRFRRRYGVGLRRALSKSIRSVNPSGRGEKSITGYSIAKSKTSKVRGTEVVTNTAQLYWLEFGTKPHALRPGVRHPGTKPITDIRGRVASMRPFAERLFRKAIAEAISTGGARIDARAHRRLVEGVAA